MKDYLKEIDQEVSSTLDQIDRASLADAIAMIMNGKRVFVDGEGRSGFIGKCFAMRMMYLGFTSYVIGETNTPHFKKDDVLVSISGSGKTGSLLLHTKKAKKFGVKVIAVTTDSEAPLAKQADKIIKVHATTRGALGHRESVQLLGSLFDQSVHLLLDDICLVISHEKKISNAEATANHF
ncbi:6-phospho-3-hexuloisomerase [Lacticaseibacillus paracasei]|uniref:6-phospho-3-hexuloisomerase n=1 Tax=Lacticaseibacillus paracasei TaxID=1597 RepID=UPI0031E2EC52